MTWSDKGIGTTKITREQIIDILFPPLVEENWEGKTVYTDSSADSNLYSAYIDLCENINDDVVRKTIEDVLNRLIKIRNLLGDDVKQKIEKSGAVVILPSERIE